MREERHLVHRLDLLRGARHGLGDVAVVARHDARLRGRHGQLLYDVGGGELGVGALVPLDRERGEALLRRPHVLGDHGDGVVEPHHLVHALDRLCLAVVHAREPAAEHGTGRHGGDLHPGDLHVDAELRCAVDLVGAVEPLRGRADQLEVLRVLERDRARHPQKNRGVHEGAVAQAAAGRPVDHLAPGGVARARIDVPGLRGGGHQHGARRGTGPAQLQTLKDLIALNHPNLYESSHAQMMQKALDNYTALNTALASGVRMGVLSTCSPICRTLWSTSLEKIESRSWITATTSFIAIPPGAG